MASTPNYNWDTPDDTDPAADGAAAIRSLADDVDLRLDTVDGLATSAVQPGDDADTLGSGAAADGQVLTSDGAGAAAWETPSAPTGPQTGIYVGTGSGTVTISVGFLPSFVIVQEDPAVGEQNVTITAAGSSNGSNASPTATTVAGGFEVLSGPANPEMNANGVEYTWIAWP